MLFVQFARHFGALLLKRMQYFKRDVKGLCFLILIPAIVTLGAVIVVRVRPRHLASCTLPIPQPPIPGCAAWSPPDRVRVCVVAVGAGLQRRSQLHAQHQVLQRR